MVGRGIQTEQSGDSPLVEPLQRFSICAELQALLERIDILQVRYRQELAKHNVLPNFLEAARIEYTYHSNAIEGNTLTLRETQLVIEGQTPGEGKPLREIYEARNHDKAVRHIETWSEGEVKPFGESHLLNLHALVLADIDPPAAGSYRNVRVRIAGSRFIPPGSHRFDELIPQTFALAADESNHPAVRAAELHYNLVAIHPFEDGNGRTARLMMNALLLQHGYPLCVIPVERRKEYLAALDEANAGKTEGFARLVLECLEGALLGYVGE